MPFLSWNPCRMLFAHDRELSSISMYARSLHLFCSARTVELYAQRERCTSPAANRLYQWSPSQSNSPSVLLPLKRKKWGGGGVAIRCGRAPLGALPPPPPKKKNGGKRSSKDTAYDFYGCCPDGCHTGFDAFSCCSRDYSHFDPLSLDCTMRSQRTLGTMTLKTKKKRTTCLGRYTSLNPYEWCWLIHLYASTRNLGVAPLMLWTPLILRRYLTIVCFWPWCSSPAQCFGLYSNWSHHDALLLHLRG